LKCPICGKENKYPQDGTCKKCYEKRLERRKKAEEWILYYPQRKQSNIEALAEFEALGAANSDGMPRGTDTSDPTSNKATRLAELQNDRLWCVAVEDMLRNIGFDEKRNNIKHEEMMLLVELRQEAELVCESSGGRTPWYDYVEANYAKLSEKKLGRHYIPSRATAFLWFSLCKNSLLEIASEYKGL